MKVTDDGLALIRQFEGFRAKAYQDAVGVWTIGYGHTSRAGPPEVSPGLAISKAEAENILRADVETFALGVERLLAVPLSPSQFSALVSFAYNVGIGAFGSSSVLKAVNARDFDAVPRRLGLWVKAGGRVLPGLVKRRAAEAALFLTGPAQEEPALSVERTSAKPAVRSKTIWSAVSLMALAALQAVFHAEWNVLSLACLMAIAALALLILRERIRKHKEEGI